MFHSVLSGAKRESDGPTPEADIEAHASLPLAHHSFAAISSSEEAIAVCDAVIDILSILFNVSGKELRSPRRSCRPVSRVRQIGMYVAHVGLGMTMTAVGLGFSRDKSTVVHACHAIEDLRDDPEFDHLVMRVEAVLRIAFRMPRVGEPK